MQHAEELMELELPLCFVGASYWRVILNDCVYNARTYVERLYVQQDRSDGIVVKSTSEKILKRSLIHRNVKRVMN